MSKSVKKKAAPSVTPWFPSKVKPIRTGVYETQLLSGLNGFSYWNGDYWCDTRGSVLTAAFELSEGLQSKMWRGLASNPEGAA